jgi:UDP-3-O-[3-hydroxymyristoyl] glucosamine N-acyltransferase
LRAMSVLRKLPALEKQVKVLEEHLLELNHQGVLV